MMGVWNETRECFELDSLLGDRLFGTSPARNASLFGEKHMDRSSLCSFMFAGSSVSRAKGSWEKNCFRSHLLIGPSRSAEPDPRTRRLLGARAKKPPSTRL